jgi:hypothetical protein
MNDVYVILSSASLFFERLTKRVGSDGVFYCYTHRVEEAKQFLTLEEARTAYGILNEGLHCSNLLSIQRVRWNKYTLELVS